MKSIDQKFREQLDRFQPTVVAEDEETIWLLSYADLMTLLFTFFVMLYSSAQMDEGKTLRKTLAAYMQGTGGSNEAATANAGPGPGGDDMESIRSSLSERIETERLLKDVRMEIKNQGLNITFSSNLLFDTGSAELRLDSMEPLNKVIGTLKEKAPQMKVRVEGHTDDVPIRAGRPYKNNWELSGARAAHIVSLFEKLGYPAENLIAVGYGSSRPVAANRKPAGGVDQDGRRRNRRVVLTVFQVAPEAKAGTTEDPK
ncbi:MAG: OmpA family protein [Bdellovibrionales bacterium]|nr:OmpA family protein [Bdellovibrionales bacterium]